MFIKKLSIPGKQGNELSYIFADGKREYQNSSVVLFGIFDVRSINELYLTTIKETVKHFLDFYHSEETITSISEETVPNSHEFLFERSIQYTYEKVTDMLKSMQEDEQRKQPFDIRRFNCILGAAIDDTLFLSVTGSTLYPFLIYPSMAPADAPRYTIINILEHGMGTSHDSSRLFSNIISGKISIPRSSIFLCNQTFLDYVNPQHIKQTISNNSIESIVPYFEKLLSRVNSRSDFSLLILSNDTPSDGKIHERAPSISSASMEHLNTRAEHTRSILTSASGSVLKKYCSAGVQLLGRIFKKGWAATLFFFKENFSSEKLKQYGAHAARIARFISQSAAAAYRAFKKFASFSGTLFVHLRSSEKRAELCAQMSTKIALAQQTFMKIFERFKALTPLSRSLFILSALFLFLFSVSIITLHEKNAVDKKDAVYHETLAAIQEKYDSAQASMLYDDRQRAGQLVDQSIALFALIDKKNAAKDDYKNLHTKIEALSLRINHIIRIDNPVRIAHIQQGADTSLLNSLQLIGAGQERIAFSSDHVFRYDAAHGALNDLGLSAKIPSIGCGFASSPSEVFFCSSRDDRLYRLLLPDQTVQETSLPLAQNEKIDAVGTYNGKMYTLDASSGMIYRHSLAGHSFGLGTVWTHTSNPLLKHARDFVIDGSVFVLGQNGDLFELRSGAMQHITVPADTEKTIKTATRIYTAQNLPLLLLLDPSHTRIVLLDKKSFALQGQIVSHSFGELKGLVLSADGKTATVLSGADLLTIPLLLN